MKIFFFPTANGIRGYFKKREVSVFVDGSGRKKIDTHSTKNRILIDFPFLRGITYFIFGIIAFFSGFDEVIKLASEDSFSQKFSEKLRVPKSALIYSVLCIIAILLSVVLLGYLPAKLSFALVGMTNSFFVRNLIIAIVKVLLILLILFILRFLPSMQELYKFNGATNIVLRNKGEVKKVGRLSHHSPLNFLNFFVFTFLLSVFVVTLVGIRISFWINWLVNLGIFVAAMSVAYELLLMLNINENLQKICVLTSFFVSIRPNITHDEVARVAYSQLNMKEKHFKAMEEKERYALSTILSEMQTKLSKVNKYEKSDVEWIIATILGKNRAEAKLVRFFDEKTYREIMKATNERASGKPLSAIFGFVEFYGLRFNVNKKVLAPRMETEVLVDEVLKESKNIKKCEVLDIGTGSGAISVSVAKYGQTKVTAIDVSKQALEVAKENAQANGVKIDFLQSDLFLNLKKNKKFDIIVSNPPYIKSSDINFLDEEVRNFDPKLALDGGEDGLDFYRKIAVGALCHFKKNGLIFLEIGKGQFVQVKKILEKSGYKDIEGIKDFNKINRVVKARYGNN